MELDPNNKDAIDGSALARSNIPTPTPTVNPCKYEFGDFCVTQTGSEGGYVGYITGSILNRGTHTYTYVQVDIALSDREGNRVGSTFSNVNNLAPGQTWKFRAPVFASPGAGGTYYIVSVEGL